MNQWVVLIILFEPKVDIRCGGLARISDNKFVVIALLLHMAPEFRFLCLALLLFHFGKLLSAQLCVDPLKLD